MQHRYIEGAEVESPAQYYFIISTATLDAEAHQHWESLCHQLESAIPTGLVKVELLTLAAMHVFYYGTRDTEAVDFDDFNDLADMLIDGAGLSEKEGAESLLGSVMLNLACIFEGYLRLFLHVRKRYKINLDSINSVDVKRLSNLVTTAEDYNDDGTSSYVLVLE